MDDTKNLTEQLRKVELGLQRIRPQPIIHNTPEAIHRLNEVRRAVPWRGRELALKQEEINLGGT